jgi:hypothetical protein
LLTTRNSGVSERRSSSAKTYAVASDPSAGLRTAASIVACIYAVGLIGIAFAPETKGKPLPQITKAKNQRVTWKEIDAEAQWLCRFIFSCEAFGHTFAQSTKGLPDYVQNFGSYQLRGRLYNSQGRSWLRISLRSPDGKNGFSTSGVISKP